MRRGRNCNCGCITCEGYSCGQAIFPYDNNGSSECLNDRSLTIDFFDSFTGIEPEWRDNSFVPTNGIGVPVSAVYNEDFIEFSGTVPAYPIDCYGYALSSTFIKIGDGMGVMGTTQGPSITIQNSDVYLELPNGSSVLIDENFKSEQNMLIYFTHSIEPINIKRQFVRVLKRTNKVEDTAGCTAYHGAIGAYSTGLLGEDCQHWSCNLYSAYFSTLDPTGVYPFTIIPTDAYIATSGGWQIDDVCFSQKMRGRSKGNVCYMDEDCGNILRPGFFSYRNPCPVGSFPFEPSPLESGKSIDLFFRAYDDRFFTNNAWRCDGAAADDFLSEFVSVKVNIPQYTINLSDTDVFSVIPIGAIQKFYPIGESSPFNNTDNPYIMFSGVPPRDCYSPPFLSFDNAFFGDPRSNNHHGNVCEIIDSGNAKMWLQMGMDSFYGPRLPLAAYSVDGIAGNGNLSLSPIPRDDTHFSVAKHYKSFGLWYEEGESVPSHWKVDKRGFYINWDSTNQWWNGDLQFLSGSGTTSNSLNSNNYYKDVDFSDVFGDGSSCTACEPLDLYWRMPCGPRDFNTVSESYVYDSSGIFYGGNLALNNSDLNNVSYHPMLFGAMGEPEWLSSRFTVIKDKRFCYNYSEYVGVECEPTPLASGYYDLSYKVMTGLDLPATDLTHGDYSGVSKLPPVFFDEMGKVVSRINFWDQLLGNNLNAMDVLGFQKVYLESEGACISLPQKYKIFHNTSCGSAFSLAYNINDNPVITPALPMECGSSYLTPVWFGRIHARVYPGTLDTGLVSPPEDPMGSNDFIVDDEAELLLFLDTVCGKLRALMHGFASFDGDPIPYAGNFKSESDIVADSFFADVEVVATSPLKLKISQGFFMYGQNNEEPVECELYSKIRATAVTWLEAPRMGLKQCVFTFAASSSSKSFIGNDALLILSRLLIAGSGSFSLVGQDASLYRRILSADTGVFILTGNNANLTSGIPPEEF